MPFDPSKPFEVVKTGFDPSKPFEIVGPRDTSRDSYEAQLEDLGLTEAQHAAVAEVLRQSDRQSELLAAQRKAARQGEYWSGVAERAGHLVGMTEDLSRNPIGTMIARPVDTAINAVAGQPTPTREQPGIMERGVQMPALDAPRMTDDWQPGGPVVAGIYNAGADLLAAFSSPQAVAMLPAAANRAVLTAWVAGMAGQTPERAVRATQYFKEGKTREAVQELASSVGELGLAELGRRQVMPSDRLTMNDVEGVPRINIDNQGQAVDLPNPDTVARNLAAPGTMRPQEQRAWGPPQAERPPEMVQFERVPIFNRQGEVVDVQVRPRIRQIVIEEPVGTEGGRTSTSTSSQIIQSTRGTVRESPAGGQISFAAEAPVLNREAINPREESSTEEVSNAERIQIPTQPYGDVQQPGGPLESQGQVPATEGGGGIPARGQGPEVPAQGNAPPVVIPAESTTAIDPRAVPLGGDLGSAGQGNLFAEPGQGEMFKPPTPGSAGVPEKPGFIAGTALDKWADDVLRGGGTHLGPDVLAAYVVRGAALIERGIRKFADWSAKMIAEHGDAIRPHLRAIFEQAQRSLAKVGADDAKVKQRKLAARGSQSEDVATEHRERLNTDPSAFYQAQREKDVRSLVAGMTNEELAAVPVISEAGPNNAGFSAKLELYRRLVAGGRPDLAWAQFSELLKLGTSMGQLINQLKQLKGASPDAVLFALDRKLQAAGYDPLTPADRIRLRVLAGKSIKASGDSFGHETAWKDAPTAENFERVRNARQEAIERDMDFQNAMRDYAPRNVWDTLTQILQGNLLTPISLVANIAGNTVNLVWRGLARDVTAVTDRIDAALRNRERLHTVTPLRAGIEAMASLKRSLPEAWRILYRGASDFELSKADARDPMKPLKAWRDMLAGQLPGPRVGGKLTVNHKLALMLEMSPPAMTATAFLRTLGASDLPARKAALARVVANEMKLRDTNRNTRKRALEKQPNRTMAEQAELESLRQQRAATAEQIHQAAQFPELYFDREALARVNEGAAKAVYQQPNAAASVVTSTINNMAGPWKFLARTVVPYVQTPVNVIGEMLSFVPPIAASKVMWHATHGDARAAHTAAGRVIVGTMLTAAGYWLAQKGLIGPSLDDPDEQQKARILSGQVLPPNHVNVSGLERALKGGDPTWREGDTTRDLARGGGVAGALLVGMANLKRRAEKTPPGEPGLNQAATATFDALMLTLGYGVNQSFLKGTATALDAIRSQKLDQWFQSYFEGLTSIPLPNSLGAVSRAARDYKPEVRDDSYAKTFANILKNRLSFAGAGKELPLKRDLWGRPVPETPDGANPFLYQFLDITKARQIPQDEVGLHLYTLWRKTANPEAIPTPPDKSLTVRGQTFKLTPEQHSQLQELVGGYRREIAEKLVNNGAFIAAPANAQIARLRMAWERGAMAGKRDFWKQRGTELDKRPAPAGFTLPE